ncbi:unnamed protein product [Rotaria socialis]|uniref:Uncharacterized protein n=1 Tax=Rotaria socialis TaxID=392032 RepID=A0A817M835_9BILA|nr:unnamed protein product [Rotaria socialis]CAF3315432.1 unnamed protein product [Rotaria socialis]CAF4450682.1 unnamed protein product [Rotaria socialis]CAF4609388.1 unnamed protein product [Rotaria socialis]CAF4854077.1 unnamed protein product [Rotaria socialis]
MGQLKDDKFHGKGKMEFASGAKYTGDWVDGAMTGDGIYIFTNGNRYERPLHELSDQSRGQWDENRAHGIGKMYYASGAMYSGGWVDGTMTGECVYIFDNGTRYEWRHS